MGKTSHWRFARYVVNDGSLEEEVGTTMKLLKCNFLALSLIVSTIAVGNPKTLEFATVIQPDPACSNSVVSFYVQADQARIYAVQPGHVGYVSYRLIGLEERPQLAVETRVDFNQAQMTSTSILAPRGITYFADDKTLLLVSMGRTRIKPPHTPYASAFRSGLDGSVVSHVGDIPNFVGDNHAHLGIVNLSPHQNFLYLANHVAREQDGKYLRITAMGLQTNKTYALKSQHAYPLESGSDELSGIMMVDEVGNGLALENNRIYQIAVRGPSIHEIAGLRQGKHPTVSKNFLHDLSSEPHAGGVRFTAINRGPIYQERETILLAGVDGENRPVFQLYFMDLYPGD